MTVNQERLYATTNAKVWAEEFMAEFGDRKDDIDEGLMIGWFANAMVIAEMHADKQTGELLQAIDDLHLSLGPEGWAQLTPETRALCERIHERFWHPEDQDQAMTPGDRDTMLRPWDS